MILKENDKVVLKKNVRLFVNGEDQAGVVGKIKTIVEGLDIALVEFSGSLVKIPVDGLELYKEPEKTEIEPEDRITITGKEYAQAVLTVCTPKYVRSHVTNADECKEVDFGIVAASGAIVANMIWEYLNKE